MKHDAYYNGRFMKKDDLKIPLSDRSIFFGDAVYDMMLGFSGYVHQADEHIERLLRGAHAIGLKGFPCHDEISETIDQLVSDSAFPCYTVYVQFSRNSRDHTHSAMLADGVNFLILINEYTAPKDLETAKLFTVADKRYQFCNIKTVNLLPAVLASTEAESNGCDEAAFHRGNYVTECAHSNIFILKNGTLITHPLNELILPGITRRHILKIAGSIGISVAERPFTINELYSADEILISSTTKLLRVCESVNSIATSGHGGDCAKLIFDGLLREIMV